MHHATCALWYRNLCISSLRINMYNKLCILIMSWKVCLHNISLMEKLSIVCCLSDIIAYNEQSINEQHIVHNIPEILKLMKVFISLKHLRISYSTNYDVIDKQIPFKWI